MRDFRATIAQWKAELNDVEANREAIIRGIEEAGKAGVQLLIFPELFLTGYNMRNEVFRLAEEIPGESTDIISKAVRNAGIHLIFGMPEREAEMIYNTALLIDPEGNIGRYRKAMLPNFGPFEEGLYYTPGDEFPVFETDLGSIGIEICYDLFYPEISKIYAGKGAEILVNISGSPSISRELFERVLPARAIENGTYMLYSNNIGTQISMVFWGGSRVIGPKGDIIAQGEPFEEGMVLADLKADDLRLARQYRPTRRDTRTDILEELSSVWSGF
jgi:predicted amidohydrolase